jgi:glycosyltransferase involved in cell wall biosynthesis
VAAPVVSVIIPARDAAPTLERTLSALRAQIIRDAFEVVVVDDGSRDRTAEIARDHAGFVRLLSYPESVGPGAARNRAVQEATAPVLAFTDADCFPTPSWLAAGLQLIDQADLVQGPVTPDPTVARTPFDRSVVVQRGGGYFPTANLFVRRPVFEAVGGFRDWVLEERGQRRWAADRRRARASRTPIGEDTLFAWTAVRQGARSAFAPDAVVHHAVVPGSALDAVADRWHWARDMPGLARLVPELREGTFHRRVFFNEVTAKFDYALAGLVAAAVTRRSWWLLAAGPYVRHVRNHARQWPRREQLTYLAGAPVVETATLAALLSGSLAWRSLVL